MAEKKVTKKKAVKKTTAVKAAKKKTVKKKTKKAHAKTVSVKNSRVKGTIERSLSKKKNVLKEVEFSFYAPLSQSVHVAGSFNDWDPSKLFLKKNKEGNWSGKTKLGTGQYEYKFLIDGQWWENDQKPVALACDGHGGLNSVLVVD